MFLRTDESLSKTWLKLLAPTFLLGFGATYLPPKPSNAAYARTHPYSTPERLAFAAVVTPLIAWLGAIKLTNTAGAKANDRNQD